MSLSTHVLDASKGSPAAGVLVRWESRSDDGWTAVAEAKTDGDGRITGWTPDRGVHRLVFDTQGTFFPEVTVTFRVHDPDAHHHVPLLLSPFAYSTYRGS